MNFGKHLVCSIYAILLPAQCVMAGNIINTAEYPCWRQLASSSPLYAAMKVDAINTANNGTETRDVMGGCALAYILDPDNRARYIDNIKGKFETRITDMIIGDGAATSSVPSHELFYALANNKPLRFDINEAVMAPSRLFKNYAALISKAESRNALYLSMLNLTGNTEYHTHFEVNALAMAGYGEILLRNAGYNGPGKDVTVDGVTATFDYMHANSESANSVMIGGVRHSIT